MKAFFWSSHCPFVLGQWRTFWPNCLEKLQCPAHWKSYFWLFGTFDLLAMQVYNTPTNHSYSTIFLLRVLNPTSQASPGVKKTLWVVYIIRRVKFFHTMLIISPTIEHSGDFLFFLRFDSSFILLAQRSDWTSMSMLKCASSLRLNPFGMKNFPQSRKKTVTELYSLSANSTTKYWS